MVASIRFWLRAFGITGVDGNLTDWGIYLFDEKAGKDRYLEDLATLWLLHFNIVFWHSCISPWQYNHVIQRS